MAKYAQGYERKNSDSKNLIIMASIIIAVIVLAIGAVILYNNVFRKDEITFASAQYEEYYLTANNKLLSQNAMQKAADGDYYIYVCSKTGTSDTNMKYVLEYIDKTEKDSSLKKLFLLDYDTFDSTDDETESAAAEYVKTALNYDSIASGYLITVEDSEVVDPSNQIVKNTKTIKNLLK